MAEEELQIRIYGDASAPTLIYLPGLHGDWTLIGAFREALGARVRFVEITYPRTLTWSLDDYAAGVERGLAQRGITEGWLLGESFSSQVVWQIVARGKFRFNGLLFAGGFVRHPVRWGVRMAERIAGGVSLTLLTRIMFGYARIARFRFRHSKTTLQGIEEFVARRTELDRQAAKHRLHLIAQADFWAVAKSVRAPVFAITGLIDPIVPWMFVRPWLRRHCPSLRDYKIVFVADHNVLGTAPGRSAEQMLTWIRSAD